MNNEKKYYEEFNRFVATITSIISEYIWALYHRLLYQKAPSRILREVKAVARNIHSICERARTSIIENNLEKHRKQRGDKK